MSIHPTTETYTSNVQDTFARYQNMQQQMMDRVTNGQSTGMAIDETRLMNAALTSPLTPAQWTTHEATRQQAVRDNTAQFWTTKGNEAKDKWLATPKRVSNMADPLPEPEPEVVPSSTSASSTMTIRGDEPEPAPMTFLQALRPTSVHAAYTNILADLRRWDELPQATGLDKIKACFLSSERIGAIVCSALLLVMLIAFIVILTM